MNRVTPALVLLSTLAGVALPTSAFAAAAENVTPPPVPTQAAPSVPQTRADILAVMQRAADWQLAHPYTKAPPTDWINGAFYTGLLALADIAPDARFRDAMVAIGDRNEWKLGALIYHADDHCVGQAYAQLYLKDHDAKKIAPMRERFDHILAHPSEIPLDFDKAKNPHRTDRWSWCDALFMAPPAWLRLHAATGDKRYLDFAVTQWWVTSDYLYDRDEHLYFRDSTFFEKREANGRKVFWSRGNGWVLAGLARAIPFLPPDHPAKARFEQQYREMAEKILSLQQDDGFWRASLLDPASYPAKETSGTGFFCFGLAWGINNGMLDREKYLPAVQRAWAALNSCIDPDGKLTHVQIVAGSPRPFPPESTMPYGVGAFLLAGSEMYRLAQ